MTEIEILTGELIRLEGEWRAYIREMNPQNFIEVGVRQEHKDGYREWVAARFKPDKDGRRQSEDLRKYLKEKLEK